MKVLLRIERKSFKLVTDHLLVSRPGCLRSYTDMLILIGQMHVLYSRPPLHGHEGDFMLVCSGPFQKASRREVAFTKRYRSKPSKPVQNRFKIRMVRKVNQFANIPFHSHMNKRACPVQVHFLDLLGFYW